MAASFSTFSSLGPIRPGSELDVRALEAVLRVQAPELFQGQALADAAILPSAGLSVQQFAHGQSNPTYLIQLPYSGGAVVLRKVCRRQASDVARRTQTPALRFPVLFHIKAHLMRLHPLLCNPQKPPGKLLSSAHAVEREFRVIAALAGPAGGGFPVPRPLFLCTGKPAFRQHKLYF